MSALSWAQTAATGTVAAAAVAVPGTALAAPALPAAPRVAPIVAETDAALPAVDLGNAPAPLPKSHRAEAPSQFQRFVQESTGRLLPVFGRGLFDNPQAYTADRGAPVPGDYVLGPGDEVRLQVTGVVDFARSLVLDRNGQVNVPKVGVVTLAGVAARDVEAVLRTHLGKVFTNFQASASIGRLRGIQVYVVGQALQPGTYQLSSLSTLVNALFVSGGPSVHGSMRSIELKRGGKTLSTLDLYDFIARGDKSKDVPLMAGDVIVIPPAGPRVAVTGATDQAAIYELLHNGDSLGAVLALNGGVPTLANSHKALLERVTQAPSQPREVHELSLDARGLSTTLRDGDVITLLGISPGFSNAVTLQGTVAAPLRYRWFEGMRLLDLIPERAALLTADYYKRQNLLVQSAEQAKGAGARTEERIRGLADQINWEYAVIERLNRSNLQTELIPFNLGRLLSQRDPAHNHVLQPGDIVTVLSQGDLRLPQERLSRLVRVEGEVAAPGVYQAQPGETLPQLLKRIGGLTPQAYLFGTEFYRESVRKRQQESLDAFARKLESQLQSQTVAGPVGGSEAQAKAQALMAQQQAQLKAQVERVRSLRSSGRVALDLDPGAVQLATLPLLPLEDGDRIHVPAMPGFVAALGAVNNENVFIHKPGKTVADVARTAGLSEDAEPDHAFLMRADGSIVARRDVGGWLGSGFDSLTVMPGDTLVVPTRLDRRTGYDRFIEGAKDWTAIFYQFGLGAAAFKTLKN
ncbi:MAG: SLBB domain-containing protein [Rhodoferax sp.]